MEASTKLLHSNTGSTELIFLTEQSGLQIVITFQKAGDIVKNNHMKLSLVWFAVQGD